MRRSDLISWQEKLATAVAAFAIFAVFLLAWLITP